MNVNQTLRSLDPGAQPLTEAERQRAAALLEQIVSTPPDPSASAEGSLLPPGRRIHRVLVVAAAAVVLAVAVLAWPARNGADAAYASWTPDPTPVSQADAQAVRDACVDAFAGMDGSSESVDPASLRVALTERRGDFVAMLLRSGNPDLSVACVARSAPDSGSVESVDIAAGGGSGPALTASPQRLTQGSIGQFGGDQPASVTDGAVGAGVSAVTIHAGDLTVQATVETGRYGAWWPGPAFTAGDEGAPEPILSYDLTLEDGTVIAGAEPEVPVS